MSHDLMIENIKTKLPSVNAAVLHSIWEIVNRAERAVDVPKPVRFANEALQFVGENLSQAEYERLSPKERAELQLRLTEQNYLWLREQFERRKAAWLVVIDGKIFSFGESLKNEPMTPKILEISRRIGKFPFIFVNDDFLAIEESYSARRTAHAPLLKSANPKNKHGDPANAINVSTTAEKIS